MTAYDAVSKWLNDNQGVLDVIIFAVSIAIAWFSGIISALRRKPIIKIQSISGPTICVINKTGKIIEEYPAHRVCISIYLKISNSGFSSTSIGNISVGYRCNFVPFSKFWWKNTLNHHWVEYETVALRDFQTTLNAAGDVKVYPFLNQRSSLTNESAKTYLEIGEITYGVVYFEEPEAWGGFQPISDKGNVALKVRVKDAFGGFHYGKIEVPLVSIHEAKKFNPSFGDSLSSVSGMGVAEA